LVTGSPEHLQAVAGAGATTILRVRPVNIPATAVAPNAPQGYTVAGQVLTASAGGFRAWFAYEVGNWDPLGNGPTGDPNGDEFPGTAQIQIDASGYMASDSSDVGTLTTDETYVQCPLAPAVVPCVNNAGCTNTSTGFSESWASCGVDSFCEASYVDRLGVHPNSYCKDFGFGTCNQGSSDVSSFNHRCFALTNGPRPDLGDGINCAVADCDGSEKYFCSLVLQIPACCRGRYTVTLNTLATFLTDFATAANPEVDPYLTFAEQGFEVNCVTGSCCSNLGVVPATCEDGVLQSECGDNEIPPFVWSPNKPCADGCVECVNDLGCDDGDACSTETCNTALGVCDRACKSGWDLANECCNGGTGAETPIDDDDACTADSCTGGAPGPCSSPDPSNGAAQHPPALGPCDDGNACTVNDQCDGVSSFANGGCDGTNVNTIDCVSNADCPINPFNGDPYDCISGKCFCTLTPSLNYIVTNSIKSGDCVGGDTPGAFCESDDDCPGLGAYCNEFADKGNCFEEGSKVAVRVRMGSAGGPINGGQFLILYDASCMKLNSVAGVAPYVTQLYKAPASEASANGSIFIAVGIDPFCVDNQLTPGDECDGPPGGADILALQFTKIGECNECELCFGNNNPQNTYLVDKDGQRVDVDDKCKRIRDNGELTLTVPGCGARNGGVAGVSAPDCNIKINSDCDSPTGTIFWDVPPIAAFSCGNASLTCRGAHESGLAYPQSVVMNGGTLAQGFSSFCCFARADDPCGQTKGCPGSVNACGGGKPEGCWTVDISDETSLDIHVQLEPPITHNDAGGELTRCIEFCLYGACTDAAVCFEENVTFGGLFNYVGKAGGKIKVPKGKWGCITAQDQEHTLRSCADPDCLDGQLIADFKGDPTYDGNWLIGGNLDGWKKKDPTADPSLNVIDILDFGTFVSQFGCGVGSLKCPYPDNDTPCPGHDGPNADINGDGTVNLTDYNFILKNFLVTAKDCCCGPETGAILPADPITEISVDELLRMGEADLIVADLNGDGLVNAEDMDAFMQGVRPSKSDTGRGGKGLRSGR
jgi:hypothetical protein